MDERYKKYFSDEETDKLLDLIYQFQLKFQLNRKNHSSLWKEIAEELRKQMIYKTPIQCKNRLENLKRKYNQMQRKKSKGVDLTMANWRYLMKIEELIKSKSLCDMGEWMEDAKKANLQPNSLVKKRSDSQPLPSTSVESTARQHHPIVIKVEDDCESAAEMELPSVLPEVLVQAASYSRQNFVHSRIKRPTLVRKRKRSCCNKRLMKEQNLGIHAIIEYLQIRDHRERIVQAQRSIRDQKLIESIEKLTYVIQSRT